MITNARRLSTAIALTVAALVGSSCSKPGAPASSDAQPAASSAPASAPVVRLDPALLASGRVQVAPSARRALADQVVAPGSVVTTVEGEASVGSLVPGRIASILVREGDRVKKGEVLAWLDAPEAARMQGDYLRAKARLWRAERTLEREKKLWESKATSERELQDAEAEVRAARAELEAARGLLVTSRVPAPREDASAGVSRIAVTSPIAGVVAERAAAVGGYVSPQDPLFMIVDPAKLTVRADIPEVAANRLEIGTQARVSPRGSDAACPAKVSARLEKIDPAKRTMGVVVTLDGPCGGLISGSFADVSLKLLPSGAAPAIVVPRAAVVDLDGTPAVFVERTPKGAGEFDVRTVRLGTSDGVDTVIEDGIREAESVVTVGAFLLKGEHLRSGLGGE